MRRLAILGLLLLVALIGAPAYAYDYDAYVSGNLVINPIGDMPGAVFRNTQVSDERYVFLIPVIVEFQDVDNSGNLTQEDLVVAIAILHDLSVSINEDNGVVNVTRIGSVTVVGPGMITPTTAEVFVYLQITNATANEAKRGVKINRPRVSEEDLLAMLVIFKAVDPQMQMHQCKRKMEHKAMAQLKIQQNKTEAKIEYEHTCYCDGQEKSVGIYSFSRSNERNSRMYHHAHMSMKGNVATQVVIPYGEEIVYDPKITVSTVSFRSTTTGIALIAIAIVLILAAIAIVLRNHSR